MLYFERWKAFTVIAVLLFGIFYSMPNVLGKETVAWMQENLPSFLPTQTVNLGLDLRGGSHLLLEVETDAVLKEKEQALVDQLRRDLRQKRIGYSGLAMTKNKLRLELRDKSQTEAARKVLHDIDRDLDVDVKDGVFLVSFSESALRDSQHSAMDQSIEIVRRRIDETGTREPSIQRQGDNRILVQLPGIDNPQRIKDLLGQTAKLSFRLVDEENSFGAAGHVRVGYERLPSQEDPNRYWVVQKRVMVSGDTLEDAQASFQNSDPVVAFRFNAIGGRRFGEATVQNVGHVFAIVLDGKVISAPVIREPIMGGRGVISGSFTTQGAQDLALLLRAGALPAPIKIIEERTVGPGLGVDSIKAGTSACLIGLLLVMVCVVLSYGLFGVFADIALLMNMALIFAVLSVLQATLTLPGIAGIVLTIGMSVDANVLIFERIREELRAGRTALSALDAGFARALSAIIDANVTTLIAGFLLFSFGSGPIKGFAVTLIIGILTSIFSAIMGTRYMVTLWTRVKKRDSVPI
ncbi:MAG: protein translocase subunit SecD [Bdellovibrionales bacterium]